MKHLINKTLPDMLDMGPYCQAKSLGAVDPGGMQTTYPCTQDTTLVDRSTQHILVKADVAQHSHFHLLLNNAFEA